MKRIAGGILWGGLVGVSVGSATALLDTIVSRFAFAVGLDRTEVLRHALWSLAVFGIAGIVAGLLCAAACIRHRERTAFLLALSALLFLGGATINTLWLPAFLHPVSLAADAALLASLAALLHLATRRARRPATAGFWAGILLVGVAGTGAQWVLAAPVAARVEPRAGAHPSVLLVVIDSLRTDHTTPGGYERDTTPNLQALAGESAWFGHARAEASWTKPSVATILTGLPPAVHGAEDEEDILPPEALTVAEVLGAAGYETAIFSDNVYVRARFGLAQGFGHVREIVDPSLVERSGPSPRTLLGRVVRQVDAEVRIRRPGPTVTRHGAEWIAGGFSDWLAERDPRRPWFAYLHFMDAHLPYDAPAPFDALFTGRPQPGPLRPPEPGGQPPLEPGPLLPEEDRQALVDAQDAAAAFVDHVILRVVREAEAGAGPDGLVLVVTADHGEAFYEHDAWTHRRVLYEEVLRVPLLVRRPGHGPSRVDRTVTLASLAATIVDAAGCRPPPQFLRFADPLFALPPGDRPAISRLRYQDAEGHALLDGGRKLLQVRRGDREAIQVFDLDEDPGERAPVLDPRSPEAIAAKRTIAGLLEEQLRAALPTAGRAGTRDLSEALRGLGYRR